MTGLLYSFTKSWPEARDLYQDVGAKLAAIKNPPVNPAAARAYIRQATISARVDWYRKRRREIQAIPIDERDDGAFAVEDRRATSERRLMHEQLVVELVARLTPAQCRAFSLQKEGYSVADIAARLCVSIETVKTHLADARKRIEQFAPKGDKDDLF